MQDSCTNTSHSFGSFPLKGLNSKKKWTFIINLQTCLSLLKMNSHNITSLSVTVSKALSIAILIRRRLLHDLIINIGNGLPSSRIPMGSSHCMASPRPALL